MPRELLLPIPHAIADKVYHTLNDEGDYLIDTAIAAKSDDAFGGEPGERTAQIHRGRALKDLATKLDTLAREAGVIGW